MAAIRLFDAEARSHYESLAHWFQLHFAVIESMGCSRASPAWRMFVSHTNLSNFTSLHDATNLKY